MYAVPIFCGIVLLLIIGFEGSSHETLLSLPLSDLLPGSGNHRQDYSWTANHQEGLPIVQREATIALAMVQGMCMLMRSRAAVHVMAEFCRLLCFLSTLPWLLGTCTTL